MPLFKIGDGLHYYAHVPKCGGSSIGIYLEDRFGALAFRIPNFHETPEPHRWSRSSAQHVDWATLTTLIPEEWIVSAFAVVRHPVSRLVSSYLFQRDVEKLIDPSVSIDDWFRKWVEESDARPFSFDNHLRPQSDIAPDWATVFPIEAGLDALVPYLDGVAGDQNGPRKLPFYNEAQVRASGEKPVLSDSVLQLVESYYAEDFRRYGYRIGEKAPVGVQPAPPRPKPGPGARLVRDAKLKLRRLLT